MVDRHAREGGHPAFAPIGKTVRAPVPATPAWPPSSLPRLFVPGIVPGVPIVLDGAPANYLGAVLRLASGARIRIFDDLSGEWLAEVAEPGKRRMTLRVLEKLRPREAVPDLWLLFAPIKRGRIDWMVEKATELGAARLLPVITRRTIVDRLNMDRLRAHAVEAAEQCERTALPLLSEPVKLEAALRDWPADRKLLFADEKGGMPIGEAKAAAPAALLIGPEGGFTEEERQAIRAAPRAQSVTLGPRILRADTAAVAAISVWMAAHGDWKTAEIR